MFAINAKHNLPTPPPMEFSPASTAKQINGALDSPHHRHVWIITGPAGCGKSTIAQYLAKQLSLPYIEGDDYHSDSNKAKMASDTPLTDNDRWDWLISLREAAVSRLTPSRKSATKPHDGVVVTCSALKRKYRDVMRIAAYNDHSTLVHFIYLRLDEETLMQRISGRQGHYMKSAMVRSQMAALEEPDVEEQGRDVLEVDCGASLTEVQKKVVQTVREALAEDV
ncbi:MAG: hypothetical protein LQ348_003810 [Seirophora lacunosa]|nr:MAG: hypothetical protein LQ344_000407 [Seirophora lacunosa]KAI4189374.1 MAG: hypothetical protein LQ348_003810 [Seirophora lacunosa]